MSLASSTMLRSFIAVRFFMCFRDEKKEHRSLWNTLKFGLHFRNLFLWIKNFPKIIMVLTDRSCKEFLIMKPYKIFSHLKSGVGTFFDNQWCKSSQNAFEYTHLKNTCSVVSIWSVQKEQLFVWKPKRLLRKSAEG